MIFTEKYRNNNMISWITNNKCNFRCDYCNSWESDDSVEKNINDLEGITNGFERLGKDWIVHISGGEPFLKKDFLSICESITTNHFISINTNLSTSNIFEFADAIDPEKVLFLSCSVHIQEREKRDPGLKKFIKKINHLQERGFNVIATYVAHPTVLHRIGDDVKKMENGGVKKVRIKTFRGYYGKTRYPLSYQEEDINLIESYDMEYPEREILNNEFSFFRNKCKAGSSFFIMDQFGNLRRCSTLNRSYGNLFKGNWDKDEIYRPCPVKFCGCPYEGIRIATDQKVSYFKTINEIVFEDYQKLVKHTKDPEIVKKIKNRVLSRTE